MLKKLVINSFFHSCFFLSFFVGQNKCQVVSNEYFAFNGQDRQDQCGNSVYLIMLVHFDYEIPSDFLFRLSTLTNTFFSTSIHFL